MESQTFKKDKKLLLIKGFLSFLKTDIYGRLYIYRCQWEVFRLSNRRIKNYIIYCATLININPSMFSLTLY